MPVFLLKELVVATYVQDKSSGKITLIPCECKNKLPLNNELSGLSRLDRNHQLLQEKQSFFYFVETCKPLDILCIWAKK